MGREREGAGEEEGGGGKRGKERIRKRFVVYVVHLHVQEREL